MPRPAVSAHSGGPAKHRRAEYADFAAALDSGAEYVELDVRRIGDGTLVCHHDAALPDGRRLAGLGYAELCAGTGYEVPLVARIAEALAGHVRGHIDLKETGYEDDLLRLVIGALGPDGFVLTSLNDASIAYATTNFPDVLTALALSRGVRGLIPLRRIQRCGTKWVAVNKLLARQGVLRQCARQGIGAMVWTVDEDRLIDRFLRDPRVDVIVTNRPADVVARRAAIVGRPD